MRAMKRNLAFFALFVLTGAVAFAQARESVRIYVQAAADNPSHIVFFRESFEAEVVANRYSLGSRTASDYILGITVRPNVILYDDGSEEPAAPWEKQFILQVRLVRSWDNAEIISYSLLFTDIAEIEPQTPYLFYQIMTNLPAFVPDYTPAAPAQVDEPRGTVPESPWVGPERREITVPGPVSAEELERIQAEALELARQEARREELARQEEEEQALREAQAREEELEAARRKAREETLEQARREELARQEAQAQALKEEQEREQELERVRQAAWAEALEKARQDREREEELARQERARQEERAREEARVKALEDALKEAQAASIREVPIPYEVEVYRDREVIKEVEVVREVPVQAPTEVDAIKEVPAETVTPRDVLAEESDTWRNKSLYLRMSADAPIDYFMVRPGQNLTLGNRPIIVPGATLGLEFQAANNFSMELDFVARFADVYDYSFMPGAGLQLKFPLKPARYFMLEPYLGAVFTFNTASHSLTPFYLEAGGGFQLGIKAGPSGALFFDVNFMHTFNNVLHDIIPAVEVIATKNPDVLWNRFAVTLSIGYKLGFVDRK